MIKIGCCSERKGTGDAGTQRMGADSILCWSQGGLPERGVGKDNHSLDRQESKRYFRQKELHLRRGKVA